MSIQKGPRNARCVHQAARSGSDAPQRLGFQHGLSRIHSADEKIQVMKQGATTQLELGGYLPLKPSVSLSVDLSPLGAVLWAKGPGVWRMGPC